MNKEQIIKQLKFAKNLLDEIKNEPNRGNYFKYGEFALEVQQKEYDRLKKIADSYGISIGVHIDS